MTPKNAFFSALTLLLLAGAPLPFLTSAAPKTASERKPPSPDSVSVFMQLRSSGAPRSIRLFHRGKLLASMPTPGENVWETNLPLPDASTVELEVQAEWEDPDCAQAVSITLEPPGKNALTATQWKDADSKTLHDLFSFAW